jgi:hypothetical protein
MRAWRAPLGRVGLGDVVLLFYVMAFAREYFWGVSAQTPAWLLTVAATLAVWGVYIASKGEDEEDATPRAFWLVVALPLLAVYALRAPFPDISFDVLNYRLLHSERALRGFLLAAGDFFPSPAPYNPAPDIVTGVFRRLLGYRLGTLVNLLALLWAGLIVERMLRPYVVRPLLRSACVLAVVFTEHILFEVNNYYVDILPLPLMLEATRLATRADRGGRLVRDAAVAAAFLGGAVAFKLANIAFAIPIALAFAFNARGALGDKLKALVAGAVAFAAPLVPFTIYIYGQTGSPVFPLYNGVFQSPYWPPLNVLDPRWGPQGMWETLAWPVVVFFRPERFSEIVVYSGRISVGFVAALVCIPLARRDRGVLTLALVCVVSALLWSAGSGYVRYALFVELLGGVLFVWLAGRVAGMMRLEAGRRAAVGAAAVVLAAQFVAAGVYVSKYEWSMRPTAFGRPGAWLDEAGFAFRDRDLRDFVEPREWEQLSQVEVWFEAAHKSNAFQALLKPRTPVLTVRTNEYFAHPKSRERFAATLAALGGRRAYALVLPESLAAARREINSKGFAVGRVTPLVIPYFSRHTRLTLSLIEVLPRAAEGVEGRQPSEGGRAPAAEMTFHTPTGD